MLPGKGVRRSPRCGLQFGPRLASLPPPPSRPRPARFPLRRAAGSPRHPSPPPGATQSFPQLGRVPRHCRGSSFSPPLPPPAPSSVRQGEKFHLLQQKREKTSPSSPSPGPGGTADRSSRRRRCHHRGEAPPPAARKSSRRAGGGGERGKTAVASAAAPAPAMLRARLAVAAATTPGQSRPVPLPAPPAPPHTVPVSLSGAGRAAPALSERAAPPAAGRGGLGKAGRVCRAPPPRPQPPPPRLGASRFSRPFPFLSVGLADAPPASGGSRWDEGRRGRLVGGGVMVSYPGGLLVCPAPPLPPPPQHGWGCLAGLSTVAVPKAGPATAPWAGDQPAALDLGRERRGTSCSPLCQAPGTGIPGSREVRLGPLPYGRGEPGRFLLGGGGWPLGWDPAPGPLAAGVQPVPRGFANNKLYRRCPRAYAALGRAPCGARSVCRAARGRAGAPLTRRLPTGLVPASGRHSGCVERTAPKRCRACERLQDPKV